jgi:anti-anti-sigma regulatory factor
MVTFEFNTDTHMLTCFLKGKFGAEINDSFAAQLSGKIEEYTLSLPDPGVLKICFDLTNTVFISSSFIRICMITARKLTPGHFSIVNAIPVIKKTFKIAGLDREFNVS